MPVQLIKICETATWVDLQNPTKEELQEYGQKYGLDPHTMEDSMQPEHLPKYEFTEGVHFLILRYYAHTPEIKVSAIREITDKVAVFFTDKVVITVRRSPASFIDLIARKYATPGKCTTSTDLVVRIVWYALETFDDPVTRLSEQVEFFEDQLMLRKNNDDRTQSLYHLKREASLCHKVLLLMQEPIAHLKVSTDEQPALQDLKDQHLKMRTLYQQALDDVSNLTNLHMSFSAQRSNDVMRVLTVFSVFFMPLTFIVGIYGMNFDFMPELRQRWGYPGVITAMGLVAAAIYIWFKKKGWMK